MRSFATPLFCCEQRPAEPNALILAASCAGLLFVFCPFPTDHARNTRHLNVSCWIYHYSAILDVEDLEDEVPVPMQGAVASSAPTRANWTDRPNRGAIIGSGWGRSKVVTAPVRLRLRQPARTALLPIDREAVNLASLTVALTTDFARRVPEFQK
jgi:hypothetical protein